MYPQLPPVIGAPWGLKKNLNAFVAGTLRGYFLPVRYGSVDVQLTRLRALYQGTLTSGCVWKNLNTSYLYNAAILASFVLFACLEACFRLSLSTRNKKKRTITSKKHAYRPETSYVLYYSLNRHVSTQKCHESRARSLRNLLVSGNECGRVFPAGVGPGSPSRDAANWLPSRFSLSVETRRRYGWLRMMVFPGARLFPSPNLVPFGRVAARERQGALSRRAW